MIRPVMMNPPRPLRVFLAAAQFLTRLPVSRLFVFTPDLLDDAAVYFPLVGAVVGLLTGVFLIAAHAFVGPAVSAVLTVAASLLLTGAFHEDGAADAADGLGGGLTSEDRLRIMQDSRIGTYGAATLWGFLTVRAACLASIGPWHGAAALVSSGAAGRAVAADLLYSLPYARPEGPSKSKPVAGPGGAGQRAAAAVTGTLPLFLLPLALPGAVVLLVTARLAAARYFRARLGGVTGDTLGLAEQVGETCVLLAVAAAYQR